MVPKRKNSNFDENFRPKMVQVRLIIQWFWEKDTFNYFLPAVVEELCVDELIFLDSTKTPKRQPKISNFLKKMLHSAICCLAPLRRNDLKIGFLFTCTCILFNPGIFHKRHIRRTQLLLPPALKVAKSDFEPGIDKQLTNDQGLFDSRGILFFHG